MQDKIFQLYPGPRQEMSIINLYLHHPLHKITVDEGEVFIYSNFITSLDGRIAIPDASDHSLTVPAQIANPRDWRLVQELTAHADLLITSGRYLREYAEGGGQKILHVYDDPRFSDLKEWRLEAGLKPWPDIAVISNHLDLKPLAEQFGLNFKYFPIEAQTKAAQEALEIEELKKHNINLVILARYMQILSADFVNQFRNRIINIHHSFLPAFAGGKPYQQAYERGVKIIPDLDCSPCWKRECDDPKCITELDLNEIVRAVEGYFTE